MKCHEKFHFWRSTFFFGFFFFVWLTIEVSVCVWTKELPPTNISNYKAVQSNYSIQNFYFGTRHIMHYILHFTEEEEKEKSRDVFSFIIIVGVQSLRIISNGKTRSLYIDRKKKTGDRRPKKEKYTEHYYDCYYFIGEPIQVILWLFSLFSNHLLISRVEYNSV